MARLGKAVAVRREWLRRFWITYAASLAMLAGLSACVYLFLFSAPVVNQGAFLWSPNHIAWAEILKIQDGVVHPVRHSELRLGGEGYCLERPIDTDLVARWTDGAVHLAWQSDTQLIVKVIHKPESDFAILRSTYLPCPRLEDVWTGETWMTRPVQRRPETVTVEFVELQNEFVLGND
jgi:hypothetical protein